MSRLPGKSVSDSDPTLDLSAERWRQISELFEQAQNLPSDQQEGLLAERCGTDLARRREVQRMLAADHGATERLDDVILAAALKIDAQAAPKPPTPRQRIGPYRIVDELGHGGMSTVYLAERDDEHYRQRVALKVVREGPKNAELHLHLRRERQILAGLDHPHIAKLLDGGSTEDGLPYFVLDAVEGEPIDSYCDRHRLSFNERLELFVEVCGAVQYAHAKLVIHRDLKPSNLLVTSDGQPKLLDFGIAKLLAPEAPETYLPPATALATPTAPGLRLLTPEYASPEQIRGESLSVATDIYSLGVMLYELLTGRRPYTIDRQNLLALERAICETPPAQPSTAVLRPHGSDLDEPVDAEPAPPHSAGDSRLLAKRLRGDLDNILLKALRKEPERRYASAAELAEDLRRHLGGRPVSARPDTLAYRTRKFVRRHRRGVAVAIAVTLVIAGLISFYTYRLAAERDRAQRGEQEAIQVAELLTSMFDAADPEQALGDEVTARELLDVGAFKIRAELIDQPALAAKLLHRIAAIYLRLGLAEAALPLIEETEALRDALYDSQDAEIIAGQLLRARWLAATGEHKAAEALYLGALEHRRQQLGTTHPLVAETLTELGDLFFTRGEPQRAEDHFRQALEIRQQHFEGEHPAIAASLNDVATARYSRGAPAEALPLLERALAIQLMQLDEIHPAVAETLSTLGAVHTRIGDGIEAVDYFSRALEIRRRIYGDDHPTVGRSLTNLGNLLRGHGEYAAAEVYLAEAVEIFRRHPSTQPVDFLKSLTNHSENLRLSGHAARSELLDREALELGREVFGSDHPMLASLWMRLGHSLLEQERLSAAAAAYREALALRREIFPAGHGRIASPLVFQARVTLKRQDLKATESLLEEALEILLQQRPDHWLTVEATLLLASCRRQQRRFEEATQLLAEGLEILKLGGAALAIDRRRPLAVQAEVLRREHTGPPF
ncbi:MAG: serine/threonine-protein kinase, partial [Acidobacteriota bacterium]